MDPNVEGASKLFMYNTIFSNPNQKTDGEPHYVYVWEYRVLESSDLGIKS